MNGIGLGGYASIRNTDCIEALHMSHEYITGFLSVQDRLMIAKHLIGCKRCAEHVEKSKVQQQAEEEP